MQRNLAKKIRAKQESGLTTVRLKWDPPVITIVVPGSLEMVNIVCIMKIIFTIDLDIVIRNK